MHIKMGTRRGWRLATVIVAAALFIPGCASRTTLPQHPPAQEIRVTLAPGDVIDIKFYDTPELNDTQTIRPDGKINLQLIDDFAVSGMTIEELRDALIERYEAILKNPEITVIARTLHGNRVYVGGEVLRPGMIEFTGRITLLEAIMQSGGFNTASAKVTDVVVVRYRDAGRSSYKVNLKPAIEGRATTPFYLEAYDIVYIPKTTIANLDQWVDQYISKLVPSPVLTSIPFIIDNQMNQ